MHKKNVKKRTQGRFPYQLIPTGCSVIVFQFSFIHGRIPHFLFYYSFHLCIIQAPKPSNRLFQ